MIDIRQEVTAVIEATVLVVAALFPIVNPLGSAAIFVNLVGPDRVHHAAVAGAENRHLQFLSPALLPAVGRPCSRILRYSDLRGTDWRRPGGRRYRMVPPEQGHRTSKTTTTPEDQILENAFYPFTLPITVGPGSISVAITLGAHLPPELHEPSLFSLRVLIAAIAGITLICLIIYYCYIYARKAEQLLGRSGTSMVMRLSSFILLCIGVQIISTGIKAYLQTIGKF